MDRIRPVTVVETPEFQTVIAALMSEEERLQLIDYLAFHPTAGDLIKGTGGLRKLRWALQGRGKRGGARIIYFYFSDQTPLFALTAYAKNKKADLSAQDWKASATLSHQLVPNRTGRKQ